MGNRAFRAAIARSVPLRSLETACKNAAAWINDEFSAEKKWTGYYAVEAQKVATSTIAASILEAYWMTSRQTFSCAATFSTDQDGNIDHVTAKFFDGPYVPNGLEIDGEAGVWLIYPPETRLRDLGKGSQY